MKRALVTGSSGFAGRHYVQALTDAGFDLTCVDVETGGDARNFFRTQDQGFDLVVHCAAVVGGREVLDGVPLAQAHNLELDAGLFQWAERVKPGRVIYISSSAAYPVSYQKLSTRVKLREHMVHLDDPSIPDQLYGWAKVTGELLARRYSGAVTVIRPFSGYGEDQDTCYPFRAFAERAKAHDDPFVIWGSADQVRDFIHIDDIVHGSLVMAADGVTGPVNMGWGRATTMGELAAMMCDAAGYKPWFEVQGDMPQGVAYRVADTRVMDRYYTPVITLEEGVKWAVTP